MASSSDAWLLRDARHRPKELIVGDAHSGIGIPTVALCGYEICSVGLESCVEYVCAASEERDRPIVIACLNPHSIVVATNDTVFREALQTADVLLPDGIGVVMACKATGKSLAGRIAGMDFFETLTKRIENKGQYKYFFLGSSLTVLARIRERMTREHPRIDVVGVLSPPFADNFEEVDSNAMIKMINASGADVLWVGMTAPKQEKWVFANIGRLRPRIVGSIGAVFDFYAGTKPRAPQWMCRFGLEWLARLVQEPKRMWRRCFVSAPIFLWMVITRCRGTTRGQRQSDA